MEKHHLRTRQKRERAAVLRSRSLSPEALAAPKRADLRALAEEALKNGDIQITKLPSSKKRLRFRPTNYERH